MKKILYLAILLLGINSVLAQTEIEKKKIISDYNQSQIENLKKQIEENNKKIDKEIQDYTLKNGIESEYTDENGNLFTIKYIINDKPVYVSTDNVSEAITTRTNFLQSGGALGLNLEGENMHVATWDGGPTLSTHQEFLDNSPTPVTRVTTPDASASNSESNHSTHVSGTIIAKGTSANAKGMAPQATLTSFDWDNDNLEALDQATNNALLISNHSYGIPVLNNAGAQNAPTWMMGCYSSDAATWDNVHFNAPYYLMVVSAGNDGNSTYTGGIANNYDKLTTNKNCKNNLVIANASSALINPNGSGQLLNLFINSSSSQGPSDDGRIKPDITADGTNVFSPISTSNSAYDTYTGTSMSAPNTSGTLLLLQQYYNQLNNEYMKSATLKGLVCHTADKTGSPGPNAIFGWGLLNAKASAETIADAQNGDAAIFESTLNNGQTFTSQVTVDGGQRLSATLCWTDPAGTPRDGQLNSSIPALVNDLDIRITNASGTVSFPWKLQLSNVAGSAITGDNLVDTVERVDIPNAPAGTYTITIAHKGGLINGLQNYSLIVTGANLQTSLSIEEFDVDSNLSVWPNPAKETLNYSLKSASTGKVKISLIDIQGRVVFAKEPFENNNPTIEGSLDLSNFSKGMYFFSVQQGNSVINKKIVIK